MHHEMIIEEIDHRSVNLGMYHHEQVEDVQLMLIYLDRTHSLWLIINQEGEEEEVEIEDV